MSGEQYGGYHGAAAERYKPRTDRVRGFRGAGLDALTKEGGQGRGHRARRAEKRRKTRSSMSTSAFSPMTVSSLDPRPTKDEPPRSCGCWQPTTCDPPC